MRPFSHRLLHWNVATLVYACDLLIAAEVFSSSETTSFSNLLYLGGFVDDVGRSIDERCGWKLLDLRLAINEPLRMRCIRGIQNCLPLF